MKAPKLFSFSRQFWEQRALLFLCCQQKSERIEDVLMLAGNNRIDFEKVIHHYQAPKDGLKLKAAYFLICNMPRHYSLDNPFFTFTGCFYMLMTR